MLTLFTTPKAFLGHFDIIQRNAIRSWLHLHPACEVILLGDDQGTAEVAREYGVRHIPQVDRNDFGTPYVNSIFERAEKEAAYSYLCYINSDIILRDNFLPSVQRVALKYSKFLLVGRRWDLDIQQAIDFRDGWQDRVGTLVSKRGKLHGRSGIDYFIFPRDTWKKIPPFAIGRGLWDNWLIYGCRTQGIPVIDSTAVITAVHQNHDYSHVPGGETTVAKGGETAQNMVLAGGYPHLFTLSDANYRLTRKGIRLNITPYYFYRRLVSLSESCPGAALLVKLVRGASENLRA